MQDVKIDLVYLWVNDKDAEWQEKRRYWANKLNILDSDFNTNSSVRFRDNGELRYSLRSAQMFAPWINKIFIVTDNQIPDWLDINHKKIKIINHKDIIPTDCLPTFNSEAIESCIANIPELSEYFLYANDDMFFAAPVTPEYFYDSEGKPIIQLRKQNWTDEEKNYNMYMRKILRCKDIFSQKFDIPDIFSFYEPAHCIDAYRKSFYLECKNIFQKEFNEAAKSKFRKENTAQRYLVNLYAALKKGCTIKINPAVYEQNFCEKVDNFYKTITSANNLDKEIKSKKTKLLCINDTDLISDEECLNIQYFLNKYFFEKQPWEKSAFKVIENIKNKNCIVFSLNTNYVKYFSVALKSLIENTASDESYDIVILHNGISEFDQEICKKMVSANFNLLFFNMTNYLCEFMHFNLSVREYWDISTYYRIFIPFIFKNYQKVLYCDSDIIFKSSVKELFEIEDEGKEILAIIDSAVLIMNNQAFAYRKQEIEQELNLSQPDNYFNAGIVMFCMNNITDIEEYSNRLHKAFSTKVLRWQDQDVLNLVFENRAKFVSWVWNMQYHMLIFHKGCIRTKNTSLLQDYSNAIVKPKIIHFTSSKKPWHFPDVPFAKDFWFYARKSPYYEEIIQSMTEKQILSSTQETALYINCQNSKRIVLWGASLFLESFIKKYNLETNNVIGIIDKNPYKTGEYIGAYKIYSPEALEELNPDEIIVTIANSTKERVVEVKDYLKVHFSKNITVKSI